MSHDESHGEPEEHDHDRGLDADLTTMLNRRLVLGAFAGAGLAALAGCAASVTGTAGQPTPTPYPGGPGNPSPGGPRQGPGNSSPGGPGSSLPNGSASVSPHGSPSESVAPSPSASTDGQCTDIPEETAGPYPADGTNGPNVLTQSGIVRSDIQSSFGSATGVADGVPLTITLTVQDQANGCTPLSGAAVYLWQCNREGQYSMYAPGIENENYLRGVQQTGTDGKVTFNSIFPGCYSGRWPHIHFEVYPSLNDATSAGTPTRTSQLALPQDVANTVYTTAEGYSASVDNLAQVSLQDDMVFGDDGGVHQLATVTGSVSAGYTATLAVPV